MSRWVPSTHRFSHLAGNHRTTCFGRPGYITNGQEIGWVDESGIGNAFWKIPQEAMLSYIQGKAPPGSRLLEPVSRSCDSRERTCLNGGFQLPESVARGDENSMDIGLHKTQERQNWTNWLSMVCLQVDLVKFKLYLSSCSWPPKSFFLPSFPMLWVTASFPQPLGHQTLGTKPNCFGNSCIRLVGPCG